jgi:uncharacterized protein with ParB-like and HNH nuclease domain
MDATDTNLEGLLGTNKVQYEVPLFQRPYEWKENNWWELWRDIINLYLEKSENHFLGTIVTISKSDTPGGMKSYSVIDGQQRLTTLFIILAAIRDHFKEVEMNSEKALDIHESYLTNRYVGNNDDRFKVLPKRTDRPYYMSIVQDAHSPTRKKSEKKLASNSKQKKVETRNLIEQAYEFFRNEIAKPIKLDSQEDEDVIIDVEKLKKIILGKLLIVSVRLDQNKDDAFLIFQSLNQTGELLTQADKIRNYLYMRLPDAQRDELYSTYWEPFEENFRKISAQYASNGKKHELDELSKAFWYYLRVQERRPVTQSHIYQTFKYNIESKKKGEVNFSTQLIELIKYSQYYQSIHFPETEKESNLKSWLKRLQRLGVTTYYPFLLSLYNEYDSGNLCLEGFEQALRYLESYLVRRLLVNAGSKRLEMVFNQLYGEVKNKMKEDDSDDLVGTLRQVLINYEGNRAWPTDDEVRSAVVTLPLYKESSNNERVKLILESINDFTTKGRVNSEDFTIEHILPQTLTESWRKKSGIYLTEEDHKQWKHTLGNLTLFENNYEMQDKPFCDKLPYLKDSSFALNRRYFCNVDGGQAWNVESIKKRADWLVDILLQVWLR